MKYQVVFTETVSVSHWIEAHTEEAIELANEKYNEGETPDRTETVERTGGHSVSYLIVH